MKFKRILAVMMTVIIGMQIVGCNDTSTDNFENKDTSLNASVESNINKDENILETIYYENKLFDTSYVHVIDITISEDDWEDLKTNPLEKTKYCVDATIDGETISNISFATKGNTSLSSVASEDSDRYSFKINFGKYEDGQSYYGLEKLNLNNIYADATYMKDYISYYIFGITGVDAPLTSYVELKINGESFGLYLALEDIGESYLERTSNEGSQLYKPETEMLGNMDKVGNIPEGFDKENMPSGDFQMPEGFSKDNIPENFNKENMPSGDFNMKGDFDPNNMPGGVDMGGMFGGSSSGAALQYTDDNIESYSDIFDNAQTKATDEDKKKVINAIKLLSEGNASEALDVTEVINYFVAHNFVMNYDSYTGTMLHNYYLMETDGKLSVIPWDYNLAFGAFSGMGMDKANGATEIINCGIDSPLSGTDESERPLWAFITSSDEYLQQYHEAYNKLIEYINSGKLEEEMNRVYEMIRPYVENDNSAFYSVEEFDKAYQTLVEFCRLRAESISKQLSGELATISDEQNSEDKIDASNIVISDMGEQNQNKDGFGPGKKE